MQDLENANSVVFTHCYIEDVMRDEQLENVGLYGFSDASRKAYCAVIYLVSKTSIGYSSELLTSKTKVVPLKEQTIPRLELLGVVILARLMASVQEALNVVIASLPVNECYFIDSTTVLYLGKNSKEYKQFVQNRKDEINKLPPHEQWHHCETKRNPADISTRRQSAIKLKENDLWLKGPEWLTLPPKTGWNM